MVREEIANRSDPLQKPWLIETTRSDLLIFVMKTKLKQIYPRGEYEVLMFFSPMAYHHFMVMHAYVNGERIKIGELVFDYGVSSRYGSDDVKWHEFYNLIDVPDSVRATLMLLYGDLTS